MWRFGLDAQEHVVDQAGFADAYGQERDGRAAWVQTLERLEGFRAGDLGIVERGERLGFYRFLENLSNPAGMLFAGDPSLAGVFERTEEHCGRLALIRIK